MRDTSYAYAVSSVHSLENDLLSESFLNQLIDAPDLKTALTLLADKGIEVSKEEEISGVFQSKMNEMWDYLMSIAPDKKELEFLIVKNDFHNLKVCLKAMVINEKGEKPFIYPCIFEPEKMFNALKERDFGELPEFLREQAKQAYEIITSTSDGQLTDLYIDKNALMAMNDMAEQSGNALAIEISKLMTVFCDIRIALRASKGQKSDIFYEYAFAPCEDIDISMLKNASMKGVEEVFHYIETTPYSYLCEYKDKMAGLEKRCEDDITALLDKARLVAFGAEPLISYYFAYETRIKNMRIILGSKRVGIDKSIIRERIRDIYV